MPKTTLLLLGILLVTRAVAQAPPFLPSEGDPAKEKNLLQAVTQRYEKDVSSLKGHHRQYIAAIYKERYELIRKKFATQEILTESDAQAYLDALAQQILKANPSLPAEGLRLLFSQSHWPNAASMGEGTILFHTGLFYRLHNESQAAFVLCHELAHYFLDHSNQSIRQYVTTLYSDDFQKKLKAVQNSEFRRNAQLESISAHLAFRDRRHSRSYEQAADSMALELMKNTGYNIREALSCLSLLDSADKDKYDADLRLSQRFGFPAFPFRNSWLEADDLPMLAAAKDTATADSLKTHPDCSKRIESMEPLVKKYDRPGTRLFLVSEQKFRLLKDRFDFGIPEYCFQSGQVARSLYFALEALSAFPDNVYLHTLVGRCLNELYRAQKDHRLSMVTELPGNYGNPRYNQLLQMIQNLRLTDFAALSYYYLGQYETAFGNNEEFVAALVASKEQFGKTDEKQKWVRHYHSQFPKGIHSF